MKHIACLLLSFALLAFVPASGNGGPVDNMRQAVPHASSNTAEMEEDPLANEQDQRAEEKAACCTDIDTCSEDKCNATKCSAGKIMDMPAVGIYAPLLDSQKPKMSKAKTKANKKKRGAVTTKALKP